MMNRFSLHILDSDSARRAQLARLVFSAGHHAEIYSNIKELMEHAPADGLIMVNEDCQTETASNVIATMNISGYWLPVIAIAEKPDTSGVVQAIKAGALDYISTPHDIAPINDVILRIANEANTCRSQRARSAEARQRLNRLSAREREVLDRLAEGSSNKTIARELDISPRTVEIHRMKMMGKLGAHHAADAVRLRIQAMGLEAA